MPRGPLRIVLTGGIGSGKSTVAERFEAAGAVVVDADRAGHDVLEPDGAAFDAVARRWPEVVSDGRIDRRALGRIVFADADQLAALEAMTHPEIRRLVRDRLDAVDGPAVLEVPIPVRWVPDDWPVVVVDVPDEVRRRRLRVRGMDDEEISQRMAAQPTRAEWLAMADEVVDNSGDRTALDDQVRALLERLT